MKRLLPPLLLASLLAACEQVNDPAGPTSDNQTDLRASQFTQNASFPLDTYVYVGCAAGGGGEYVHLTGRLHALYHVTLSNTGSFKLKVHFQPQGVSGIGLSTGAKYQGTGVTQSLDRIGQVGAAFTYVNNFRIIGQGRGNNYLVHEVLHLKVNANGTLSAAHGQYRVECK
jgi:hypothetical protein